MDLEIKKWLKTEAEAFGLAGSELQVLRMAANAWQRWADCKRVIDKSGMVYQDRFQQPKERPECEIERKSMSLFLKALRELGLQSEEAPAEQFSRPPRLKQG